MTWNPDPPQGFTSEQGLVIIGRPSIPRFGSPQGSDQILTPPIMAYNIDWINSSWQKRIPLTINAAQIPSTQTDYPLKIDSTFPELIGATEEEIRTAVISNNILSYQIQEFDSSTGKLIYWTKKPTIADSDVTFVYHDNPDAISEEDSATVWSDYLAVWLLNNNSNDSTANNHDITVVGAVPIPNQGYAFNGIDQNLEVDIPGMTWFDTYSIRIDFELVTPGATGTLFVRDVAISGFRCEMVQMLADNKIEWIGDHDLFDADFSLISPNPLSLGKHTIVLEVTANTDRRWYLDGVDIGNVSGDFRSTINPTRYGFAANYGVAGASPRQDFLECAIQAIFEKNSLRGADRILTELNNETTSSFYSIGAEEDRPELIKMGYNEGGNIMGYNT